MKEKYLTTQLDFLTLAGLILILPPKLILERQFQLGFTTFAQRERE